MGKKQDPDVLALKRAVKALNGCTSRRVLAASLEYLQDRYLQHPSPYLPDHLKPPAVDGQPQTGAAGDGRG